MAHRQMVRHWTLTPAFQGSNPCGPVKTAMISHCCFFMPYQILKILTKILFARMVFWTHKDL